MVRGAKTDCSALPEEAAFYDTESVSAALATRTRVRLAYLPRFRTLICSTVDAIDASGVPVSGGMCRRTVKRHGSVC